MKKITATIFVILVGLSVFIACSGEETNNNENVQNTPGFEELHNTITDQPAY